MRFNYIAMVFIMQYCFIWLCILVVKMFMTQDFIRLKNRLTNVVELFMVALLEHERPSISIPKYMIPSTVVSYFQMKRYRYRI